ncbi:MAG TPA: kelch repeat-containing protein [Candidatus Dormibacteraeota bacterium]|nr:kelch repeat-containing protein [Candidatus Dormibacteraeota bacterium]
MNRQETMRPLIGLLAAICALAPMTASATAASLTGGWTAAGNLSTQRPGPDLSVLLTDGRVLVAGSSSSDYNGIGNVDLYDPARGWSTAPSLDGDPMGAVASPLPDGGVLIAGGTPWHGGFDGPGPNPVAAALTWEPGAGAWTAAPSMSIARNNATATALADGRVLVAGGYDRKVIQLPNPNQQPFCCLQIDVIPLATTEIFDPIARSWSASGNLAHARYGQLAVGLKGGQVLVVGGQDEGQTPNPPTYIASAELFDPATGKWSSAGDIGQPRSGFTLTALADGRALLVGGVAADHLTVLRSTLVYDPRANVWSAGPDMKTARTEHATARLNDGRVLVAGGVDYLGRIADSELFDPTTGKWIVAGALGTARSDAAMVALKDGRVLVAGGLGSNGPLSDAELFDPAGVGAPASPRIVDGLGSWITRPAVPAATYAQAASILRDGRVLVLPGGGYPDYVAQIYDPMPAKWTTAFTRPSDQKYIAAVVMADDRVLVVTLDSEGLTPGKAEIIDVHTGYSKAAASPGTLGTAQLTLLPDGRIWLTGGPYGDRHTFFYDAKTDRWSPGPDVPPNLYVGSTTIIDEHRVLVSGYNSPMILDTTSDVWIAIPGFPQGWHEYSTTRLSDGDVLFAGGSVDKNDPNRTIQVPVTRVMRWNHATGALGAAHDMPGPRLFAASVVLKDGRVMFAGGVPGTADAPADPLASAEIYDPTKNSWTAAESMPEARSQMTALVLADGTVLAMGGYGLFNPSDTLVYSLATPRSAAAVSSFGQAQQRALIIGLVMLVISGLIAFLLVRSGARRRYVRRDDA